MMNNKVIAKYMNLDFDPAYSDTNNSRFDKWLTTYKTHWVKENQLEYHSNWEWQRDVVKQIITDFNFIKKHISHTTNILGEVTLLGFRKQYYEFSLERGDVNFGFETLLGAITYLNEMKDKLPVQKDVLDAKSFFDKNNIKYEYDNLVFRCFVSKVGKHHKLLNIAENHTVFLHLNENENETIVEYNLVKK